MAKKRHLCGAEIEEKALTIHLSLINAKVILRSRKAFSLAVTLTSFFNILNY